MNAAESQLLQATHDKVHSLAEAFAGHVAVCEALALERSERRASRTSWLTAIAAWAAVGASVINLLMKH